MAVNDPLNNCKTDTCSFVFGAMKSMKGGKHFVCIFFVKTGAVIHYKKNGSARNQFTAKLNNRGIFLPSVFPGITKKVVHHNLQEALVTIGKIQQRDELARANARDCLHVAGSVYKLNSVAADDSIAQQFNTLLTHYNSAVLDRFTRRDFSAVFERYIHN